jgi:hypothetical protein
MRLILLFLLLPFVGMAQNDTTKYYKSLDYGWNYQRLKARAALVLPSDTVTNKLGIVTIDTSVFVGNGVRWAKVGGAGGGGGGTADSTIFYTKFRSDTSRSNIYTNINTKLNKSDSTIYYTKYRSDTSRSNIYSAISNKLNTSDTANKFVNSITRTLGKDSIIYFVGSTRYAIKDSVGANPAPLGYYGAFADTLNQPIVSTTIAYPINYRVTELSNGVSIVNDNRILFANAGIYNIQFSAQFTNSSTSSECGVSIWLRKNGVDIPGSTGYIQLPKKGSGQDGEVLPAWNFVLSMASGDSLVWYWRADNTTASITAFPAGINPTRPSTASAILTVTQQSGIMAGTGITGIGTSGNAQTGATQILATNGSGTDFNISSASNTHTFNLPTASAINRGALSSADWSTFNAKLNTSDSTIYQTKFSSDSARTNIYNAINTNVKLSDSTLYQTKFRSDTARTNTYTALTGKIGTADTSVFQRKSIDAYSFQANNTPSIANATANYFRDSASKTLSSGITWNGTPPSGTQTHQYRWSRIGNLVNLYISLVYSTAGANNTQVTIAFPTDLPDPFRPTGLTAANEMLYSGSAIVTTSNTTVITTAARLTKTKRTITKTNRYF